MPESTLTSPDDDMDRDQQLGYIGNCELLAEDARGGMVPRSE